MLIVPECEGCIHDRKETCPVVINPGTICKGKVTKKGTNEK